MIWAVLDTNTLVSGLLWPNSNPGRIIDLALDGNFIMVTSPALLSEFDRVLRYEKLRRFVENPSDLVVLIEAASVVVDPDESISAVKRDEADNRVLEAAQAGHADYIVTGDDDLLELDTFDGTEIVNARRFIEILGSYA